MIFNLFGYGYLVKNFIFKFKKNFEYIDIFFGIFFLILLSIFFRFLIPLKVLIFPLFFIGLLLSILFFKKIQHLLSLNFFLIVIAVGILIEVNPLAGDSHLYHLQLIKWYSSEKIVFGLANLEKRFGHFSVWHILTALYAFDIFKVNLIYLVSTIPFIILSSQVINLKTKKIFELHNIFIISSTLLVIYFGVIHPSYNGPIFNNMGSVEVDSIGIYLGILSFYFFLKFLTDKDKSDFIYLMLFTVLSYLVKISNALFILLPIFCILKYRINLKEIKLFIFFVFLINFFWLLTNFFTSGCLVYPIKQVCFDLHWSLPLSKVDFFTKETMAFARSKENLNFHYLNFKYYLETFDWFLPWLNNFFIKISFIKICFSIIIFSIFFLILKFDKKKLNTRFPFMFIFIFFIINVCFWLLAPDMRFAYGIFLIITIFIFSFSCLAINLKVQKYFIVYKSIFILGFVLLIFKNIKYVNEINLFSEKRNYNYSKIKLEKKINGYEIFKPSSGDCNLFQKICVYELPNSLKINRKLTYLHIKQ